MRRQLILYVVLLNFVPAAFGVYFLNNQDFYWFVLVELTLLITIPLGWSVIRNTTRTREFIESSKTHLIEGDFSTRYLPEGIEEVDSLITLFNDMLEKLHEEQLKLGEQRGFFDRLLRATPVGIVIFDFNECINNANPAATEMLGLALEDIKGHTLAQLDSPLAAAILESAPPCILTLVSGRRYRIQRSSFYDRGFQRQFLLVEELTAELQTVERQAYEKLIRMTSHEVKNTIGVTNSLLEGCRDYCDQLNSQDRQDFLKALSVVITRNTNLADFMSRLSLVVHMPTPDPQIVQVKPILESIQSVFLGEANARNIELTLSCDQVPAVMLDEHLFEQALINILKNACEAIGEQGYISLSLTLDNDKVLLAIRDSAGALSEQDRANIFKPFYTNKANGQGVGLMLVREILDQHNFKYSLDYEQHHWTEFRIWMDPLTP